MKFSNRDKITFSVFGILIIVFLILDRENLDPLFLILFMIIGLLIAILASEKAVEGTEVLGKKLGLTPYVSGVLSSLASNSPELVIGFFAILSGKVEFAIAFIIMATGFNILMLGLLIILGNGVRKKPISIPEEVIEIEVPIVRVAIVIIGAIFVYGIVLFTLEIYDWFEFGTQTIPYLPYEANVITVLVYVFYLFFILRHNLQKKTQKSSYHEDDEEITHVHSYVDRRFLILVLVLAFSMIFFAGEMISSSVEHFLAITPIFNEFELAFFIGAAASIPEHAIALLAIRHEGGIELGLGNLIAGSMQNLLLMTGLVSLFSFIGYLFNIDGNVAYGIPLIHIVEGETPIPFLLVQFGFAWLMLFLIKSSMTDDKQLDVYEGFTITVAQLFVFIIFLRGILGF